MALEKTLLAVPAQVLTSDGGKYGQIQVPSTVGFKLKQRVQLFSNTVQIHDYEVKRVVDETNLLLGPKSQSLDDRSDLTSYLTSMNATILAPEQDRQSIVPDKFFRAVFEESPTVAIRTFQVDHLGRRYSADNPIPVQLSDGSVNIGTVNAQLNVQLNHKDNDPKTGDIHDSVRIGNGQYEADITSNNELKTFDPQNLQELENTQTLLQTEFDDTKQTINNTITAVIDTNNKVINIVLPSFLGVPLESLLVVGSPLPTIAADTWIATDWTPVKDFASFGIDGHSSALGKGFAIWSTDGGATISRYENVLISGFGAFSDPPQGATHLKIAFQNLSPTTNTFTANTILRYHAQGLFMAPVNAILDPSFPAAVTKSISAGQRPDNLFDNVRIQGVDPNNTTAIPLGSSEVFRGLWFNWQNGYIKMLFDLFSNTTGTVFVDFSQQSSPVDGDESSVTESLVIAYDPTSTPLLKRHIPVQSKWVRIRYQNDVVPQTMFALDTSFTTSDPGLFMGSLNSIPSGRNLAGIVRNIPTLRTPDGNSFQDTPVSTLGNPKQSINEIHDDILIKPLSSAQASQTIVGTSVSQLDPSPLPDRRVVSITNEGPLRIAVGHSPSMTFDSHSIRMDPKSSRSFGIDPSVPIYAICENLGGTQTISNRSPSSASGTSSNPNNVVSSNDVYSNITSTGQTINASGFTAGTSNAIASLKLGIEANRPSGITNTASFIDSKTGNATSNNTVSTTSPVISATDQLYIVAVSRRNSVSNTVNSISGLGLTWFQLASQISLDSKVSVDVWYATGTPTISSSVTATFSSSVIHSHISVTRYSNVNTSSPILGFQVGSGNDSSPTTPALSGINNGVSYMAVSGANRTMTPGSTYTLSSSELTNDAGNSDSLSVEYKTLTTTGSETPTGILSGNANWASISLIINPSDAPNPILNLGYTLSSIPGSTNSNLTISSSTDIKQYVDITGDRSWVYGDIANINIILTAQQVSLVQANVDWLFIELTDTTGNTSRISLWQGGKAVT